MRSYRAFYVYTFLFVRSVMAVSFASSQPTATTTDGGRNKIELSPKPTAKSQLSDLRARNLFRRQYLPSDTCGYLTGNEAYPLTCPTNSACAYNTEEFYFGCCMTDSGGNFVTSDCPAINTAYSSCYDYAIAYKCDSECYSTNRVCASTAPYCALALLDNGRGATYHEYYCQTDYTNFPTLMLEATFTTSGGDTTISSPKPISTLNDNVITTSPTSAVPSPTTSTTPGPSYEPTPHHSNKGAIAGGVIGGLLAVGAIAGVSIFLLHRKKQNQRKEAAMEVSQM